MRDKLQKYMQSNQWYNTIMIYIWPFSWLFVKLDIVYAHAVWSTGSALETDGVGWPRSSNDNLLVWDSDAGTDQSAHDITVEQNVGGDTWKDACSYRTAPVER